jgi:hypothetical protein
MKLAIDPLNVAPGDLALLAYAVHMADTARTESAKRLFATFVELERRRFNTGPLLQAGTRSQAASVAGEG